MAEGNPTPEIPLDTEADKGEACLRELRLKAAATPKWRPAVDRIEKWVSAGNQDALLDLTALDLEDDFPWPRNIVCDVRRLKIDSNFFTEVGLQEVCQCMPRLQELSFYLNHVRGLPKALVQLNLRYIAASYNFLPPQAWDCLRDNPHFVDFDRVPQSLAVIETEDLMQAWAQRGGTRQETIDRIRRCVFGRESTLDLTAPTSSGLPLAMDDDFPWPALNPPRTPGSRCLRAPLNHVTDFKFLSNQLTPWGLAKARESMPLIDVIDVNPTATSRDYEAEHPGLSISGFQETCKREIARLVPRAKSIEPPGIEGQAARTNAMLHLIAISNVCETYGAFQWPRATLKRYLDALQFEPELTFGSSRILAYLDCLAHPTEFQPFDAIPCHQRGWLCTDFNERDALIKTGVLPMDGRCMLAGLFYDHSSRPLEWHGERVLRGYHWVLKNAANPLSAHTVEQLNRILLPDSNPRKKGANGHVVRPDVNDPVPMVKACRAAIRESGRGMVYLAQIDAFDNELSTDQKNPDDFDERWLAAIGAKKPFRVVLVSTLNVDHLNDFLKPHLDEYHKKLSNYLSLLHGNQGYSAEIAMLRESLQYMEIWVAWTMELLHFFKDGNTRTTKLVLLQLRVARFLRESPHGLDDTLFAIDANRFDHACPKQCCHYVKTEGVPNAARLKEPT
ncbi:MAG: hypothetical protein Q7T63_01835 [Burkholderiaceae bacterium]|nr:hypothetical protein [Burkholderiaceae bacterium]MDO9090916.1 hypothetical protein [Burkholderiaceae bacterium]